MGEKPVAKMIGAWPSKIKPMGSQNIEEIPIHILMSDARLNLAVLNQPIKPCKIAARTNGAEK